MNKALAKAFSKAVSQCSGEQTILKNSEGQIYITTSKHKRRMKRAFLREKASLQRSNTPFNLGVLAYAISLQYVQLNLKKALHEGGKQDKSDAPKPPKPTGTYFMFGLRRGQMLMSEVG